MFLKAVEVSNDGNAYYFLGEIEKNERTSTRRSNTTSSPSRGASTKNTTICLLERHRAHRADGYYAGIVKFCRELYERPETRAKTKVESVINKFLWTDNEDASSRTTAASSSKERNTTRRFRLQRGHIARLVLSRAALRAGTSNSGAAAAARPCATSARWPTASPFTARCTCSSATSISSASPTATRHSISSAPWRPVFSTKAPLPRLHQERHGAVQQP